jgi:hypothetical protein
VGHCYIITLFFEAPHRCTLPWQNETVGNRHDIANNLQECENNHSATICETSATKNSFSAIMTPFVT